MPERKSLLSSQARIQAPWVKVTFGEGENAFTFGVFDRKTRVYLENAPQEYREYDIQYPNYIQRLNITKINGQVNQYTLTITYPVRPQDDPNFFEKVFSSVSKTRKIKLSYGDASMPAYCYKDEEALITKITQQFNLEQCTITYVIYAVSTSIVGHVGNFTFPGKKNINPSQEIFNVLFNPTYKLNTVFTGMTPSNFNSLVARGDKQVDIVTKTNISPIDYIAYLASCMIPAGSTGTGLSTDIYIMTLHDNTSSDVDPSSDPGIAGPYFKITRTSYVKEQSDAYELDIGYNTATIVTNFSISKDENYSILYDYANKVYPEQYTRRLDKNGN